MELTAISKEFSHLVPIKKAIREAKCLELGELVEVEIRVRAGANSDFW